MDFHVVGGDVEVWAKGSIQFWQLQIKAESKWCEKPAATTNMCLSGSLWSVRYSAYVCLFKRAEQKQQKHLTADLFNKVFKMEFHRGLSLNQMSKNMFMH